MRIGEYTLFWRIRIIMSLFWWIHIIMGSAHALEVWTMSLNTELGRWKLSLSIISLCRKMVGKRYVSYLNAVLFCDFFIKLVKEFMWLTLLGLTLQNNAKYCLIFYSKFKFLNEQFYTWNVWSYRCMLVEDSK